MIDQPRQNPRPWLQIILVALVLQTFAPLVRCDFVQWDDPATIALNPRMNPATWETVTYYWRQAELSLYIPVTQTVWAALTSFARVPTPDPQGITLNPMVFHTFNVLVHAGSALLVFAILARLTGRRVAALLGALVFAVHPVQVDSVAWISGLKDVLWGFFSFAAILCYLIHVQDRRRAFYVGGWLLLALAMLSKPTAMVTPALVIVIDRLLLKRAWRRVLIDAGPWLALSIPCMIVARLVQTGARVDGGPLWARPLIAADSLAFYVSKIFWPMALAPDYGHRPAAVLATGSLYVVWLIPVGLAVFAIRQLRHRPWIAAGLAVFAIATLPTLGWIPFSFQFYSTTADHYLYVSLLGVAIIVAYFVAHTTWPLKKVILAIGIPIALLSFRSMVQTRIWTDTQTLFTHNLNVNPNSFIARIQLATLHLRDKRPDLAEPLLSEAIKLEPELPRGYEALAKALFDQQKYNQGAPVLMKYIELQSKFPRDRRPSLAASCAALGRYYELKDDYESSLKWYREALRESPDDPEIERLFIAAMKLRASPPSTQP